MIEEQLITYPQVWNEEYKATGFVGLWRDSFPKLFQDHKGSCRLATLDLFAQYALMFQLRKTKGIHSITWFKLAAKSKKSKNRERTLRYWQIIKERMGEGNFTSLQNKLWDEGFTGFKGEPDLFCWEPESGEWFFAEAKGNDDLLDSQFKWFQICEEALKRPGVVHVYRLIGK
jgi:hypothetical protein